MSAPAVSRDEQPGVEHLPRSNGKHPSAWQASSTTHLRLENAFGRWPSVGSSSWPPASASPGLPSKALPIWRDRYSDLNSAAAAVGGDRFRQLPMVLLLG